MAVVYSKVLLFDPPLIYTAPDICVFGAVLTLTLRQAVMEQAVSSATPACSADQPVMVVLTAKGGRMAVERPSRTIEVFNSTTQLVINLMNSVDPAALRRSVWLSYL